MPHPARPSPKNPQQRLLHAGAELLYVYCMLRYPTGKNNDAIRTRIRSQPVDRAQMWCVRPERAYSVVLKQLYVVAVESVAVAVAAESEDEVAGATRAAQASNYRAGSVMLRVWEVGEGINGVRDVCAAQGWQVVITRLVCVVTSRIRAR